MAKIEPGDVVCNRVSQRLPAGVQLRPLTMHPDERGRFTEVFRSSWPTGIAPVQWNATASRAGVLRGVHVHLRHSDYLITLSGRASVGLCDLRRGSPTERAAVLVEMCGETLSALTIPAGVAHGFYFHEPSTQLYAVSEYWDTTDELGCHWADPELQIPWPVTSAIVSARDAALPSLSTLSDVLPRWQSQ
jgi:dTDP-4-dehydrorhamnose 3,5-epimerase